MKINRVNAAVAAAAVFGLWSLVLRAGDLLTAYGVLGFIKPEYRAAVMSDSTWTFLATLAFLWLAYELSRDAGLGAKALKDSKEANERAWAFQPEFLAKMADLKVETEHLNALAHKIDQHYVEFKSALANIKSTSMQEFMIAASEQAKLRMQFEADQLRATVKNEINNQVANLTHHQRKNTEFDVRRINSRLAELSAQINSLIETPEKLASETLPPNQS